MAMLQYGFMQNGFAAGGIVALLAGVVGWFLVLRGEAFAGHALSHVGFAGAAGAVLAGLPPLTGLAGMALCGGAAMGLIGRHVGQRDVAIGMVLSVALGLGLLFLHFFTASASQATSLLFGNLLAVDRRTVWMLAAIGLSALAVLGVLSRPLVVASLQPDLAEARGLRLRPLAVGFLMVAALATAACSIVTGVLLVFTLMVGPAAAAQRVCPRILSGIALSAGLALLECWGGLAASFFTDWPVSFWIAAFSFAIYGAAHLITRPTA